MEPPDLSYRQPARGQKQQAELRCTYWLQNCNFKWRLTWTSSHRAQWLEHLTVNATVATLLGLIPATSTQWDLTYVIVSKHSSSCLTFPFSTRGSFHFLVCRKQNLLSFKLILLTHKKDLHHLIIGAFNPFSLKRCLDCDKKLTKGCP